MSQARSVHNSGHGGDAHHGGDRDSNVHWLCSAVWTGLLHSIDWLWSAMWQVVGSLITNVAAIKLDQWSDGLALCIMVVGEWMAIAELSRQLRGTHPPDLEHEKDAGSPARRVEKTATNSVASAKVSRCGA